MTMLITIQNKDSIRTARVTTFDKVPGVDEGNIYFPTHRKGTETEIKPGESKDFYVHSGCDLKIEEVQVT